MNLNGKIVGIDIDLQQFQDELLAAGIQVPALGTAEDDLHTYNEKGEPVDLPSEAAHVLATHVLASVPSTADLLTTVADQLEMATTPKQQAEALRALAAALRGQA